MQRKPKGAITYNIEPEITKIFYFRLIWINYLAVKGKDIGKYLPKDFKRHIWMALQHNDKGQLGAIANAVTLEPLLTVVPLQPHRRTYLESSAAFHLTLITRFKIFESFVWLTVLFLRFCLFSSATIWGCHWCRWCWRWWKRTWCGGCWWRLMSLRFEAVILIWVLDFGLHGCVILQFKMVWSLYI